MTLVKNNLRTLGISLYLLLFSAAQAIGASDPFDKATDKANELSGLLSGKFAISVCTVIIILAAIALMFNKLRMDWALRIIGGAIIIGSGAGLADWMFS